MQRIKNTEMYTSQLYISELLADERANLNRNRLSVKQRFQLCIQAIQVMQEIVKSSKQIDCLGLYGFIVNTLGTEISKVSIGAFTYPTNEVAAKISRDLIVTTTDSPNTDNEKKAVQLLGLLFIEMFRICWTKDPLAEKAALMIDGKLPVTNCFKYGLQNDKDSIVDDVSAARLSQLLINMCQFNAEKRLTLAQALQEFTDIQSTLTMVLVKPHISQLLNSAAQTTRMQQAGVLSYESTTDIDVTFGGEGGNVRMRRTRTIRFFGDVDPAHPHNHQAASRPEEAASSASVDLAAYQDDDHLSHASSALDSSANARASEDVRVMQSPLRQTRLDPATQAASSSTQQSVRSQQTRKRW